MKNNKYRLQHSYIQRCFQFKISASNHNRKSILSLTLKKNQMYIPNERKKDWKILSSSQWNNLRFWVVLDSSMEVPEGHRIGRVF